MQRVTKATMFLSLLFVANESASAGGHTYNIMLTGYWPPTNEMVRRFSPNPDQNPDGWLGANWQGRGYNIYAFFPEFPDGTWPIGEGDFEVDYQDTSQDWWPIANGVRPAAIITYSRGFNNSSWEVEMNQFNRAAWIDDYQFPFQPTPAPPDDSVPAETLRPSTLPVQEIVDAVNAARLGIFAFICFTQDGGGFLSEFIGYHGVWYQDIHADPNDDVQCVAAGHIHVGQMVQVPEGTEAVNVTLHTLIDHIIGILGLPGDWNGDDEVNLLDFAGMTKCSTGPGGTASSGCTVFDFDSDGDVDWTDFGVFQTQFTSQ